MKKSLLIALLVVFAFSASAATIIQDNFATPSGSVSASSGFTTSAGGVQNGVPSAGINRQIISQWIGGPQFIDSEIIPGLYLVSADVTTNGMGTIVWSAQSGSWNLLGGDYFMSAVVDPVTDPVLGGTLQFFVRSAGGESVSSLIVVTPPGATTWTVNLSTFTGTADLSAITAAGFYTGVPNAKDIAYSGFTLTNVPEPGTYALMGAGLAALAYFRRRK